MSVQTRKRHGIGCQPRHGRNTRILLQRICRRLFILELFVLWYSCNITYHFKEIFAYCDNFLYFAHRCAKHCTKILKLSFAVRTLPIACSKLGKTQIIKDAGRGMVRNTGFCDQNTSRSCTHNRFRANVYLYNCPEEIPRYGCAATSGA